MRLADELEAVDALAIPGGESTTMSKLLRAFDLEQPLRNRLDAGLPTLTTDRYDAYYSLTRPISPSEWLAFAPVAGGRVTHYTSCLLYTSPSPRD